MSGQLWNGPVDAQGRPAPMGTGMVGYTLQALPPGAWPERDEAFRDAGVKREMAALRERVAFLEAALAEQSK